MSRIAVVVAPRCAPTRRPRSIVGADPAAIDVQDCRGGRAQVRSYRVPRSIVGADPAAIDVRDCRGGRAQVRSVGADPAAIDVRDCHGGRAQVRSYKVALFYCRTWPRYMAEATASLAGSTPRHQPETIIAHGFHPPYEQNQPLTTMPTASSTPLSPCQARDIWPS